eukprot:CAMPEP_0172155662 /NCGR_PEP_ID=MMETSP1050-20130122/2755_1 /TAXON_ID=233186 /ORGANISM="Cryptomonas curvata, Strain CCAP979/52" /LENGTH=89 /DNA_ID=CAMNT_0012824595 /DNA_START=254 /DNA_END=523 /DNA_ORIENTATION=+
MCGVPASAGKTAAYRAAFDMSSIVFLFEAPATATKMQMANPALDKIKQVDVCDFRFDFLIKTDACRKLPCGIWTADSIKPISSKDAERI